MLTLAFISAVAALSIFVYRVTRRERSNVVILDNLVIASLLTSFLAFTVR